MLIVGAKGFSKEVLEILHQNEYQKDIAFYDDVNCDVSGELYGKFKILKEPCYFREPICSIYKNSIP